MYYTANNGHIDVLQLLVKVGTNINTPSQRRYTAASSISVILGIANILKYLIKLKTRTFLTVRILAYMYHLKKNWIN